jgi:hypothetical protein
VRALLLALALAPVPALAATQTPPCGAEAVSYDPVDLATYGYGVANWHLSNGERGRAREIFEKVVAGPQWNAFGYIAAEGELARLK